MRSLVAIPGRAHEPADEICALSYCINRESCPIACALAGMDSLDDALARPSACPWRKYIAAATASICPDRIRRRFV
jgi:hypothetical protein